MENIPFIGTIYPFTPGTYVTMAFWWLLVLSVVASVVVSVKFMK